jgi:hypothetical protein
MREALFLAVSRINTILTSNISNFSEFLCQLIVFSSAMLLKMIDIDRMIYAESAVEQQETISELEILSNIERVKNDAISKGSWRQEHGEELNMLGNILYHEHDWEVEEVQRYIQEIVKAHPLQEEN